jgi:Concanavalin A-like lectin/glucanases superfamily
MRYGFVILALAVVASAHPIATTGTIDGLKAAYAFDDAAGKACSDASGNNLTGALSNGVSWSIGKHGGAVSLIGHDDHVDLGNPPALRITGSMTVSAWINSRFFPYDDAPIVSKRDKRGNGYQLDTTIDKGPRTIGFKLSDSSGASMTRYGATPLKTGTWYYVTGVYDASARTLNVYLNGQLDNGELSGTVTASQRDSTQNVNIGRRPGDQFVFAGLLDEVRIYSRALANAEIRADMDTPLVSSQR